MKQILLYILIGLFMLFSGIEQVQAQEGDSALVDSSLVDNSLLWEISGNGLKTSSYLYGTIHVIPKDSFFILPQVEEKIHAADRLVLEVAMDGSAVWASAMGMMMIPPPTLQDLLEAEDYEYLKHFMKDSMTTPLPMFQLIKPIYIAQHISSSYCMEGEQSSYELHFMDLFDKADKPVSGLETAREQMNFLDAISLEEQALNLMETVRNPRKACEQYHEMVSLYRNQDLRTLSALTQDDPELGSHLEQLLDKRNQNWIGKIEEMAKEEVIFVAVGAAHLAGPNGVIELLRGEGYDVEPVKAIPRP